MGAELLTFPSLLLYCVSDICPEDNTLVEPVPLGFVGQRTSFWFLVCPVCHYVFDKRNTVDMGLDARDAPSEWVETIEL